MSATSSSHGGGGVGRQGEGGPSLDCLRSVVSASPAMPFHLEKFFKKKGSVIVVENAKASKSTEEEISSHQK